MLIDYNDGPSEWSAKTTIERYHAIAKRLGQKELRDLTPVEHQEGTRRWIYPVLDKVIDGIKAGDPACIELGIEYVESGHKQAFGWHLHRDTARALRHAALSPAQCHRLRKRILDMLVAGDVPREYQDYAKLLRRIGLGEGWRTARGAVDESKEHVMRFVRYFEEFAAIAPAEQATSSARPPSVPCRG